MGAGDKKPKNSLQAVVFWLRKQPPKVKTFLGVVAGLAVLVFLRLVVSDHDNLFVAAEAVHAIGISLLVYKLTKEKNCAGQCGKAHEAMPGWLSLPALTAGCTL